MKTTSVLLGQDSSLHDHFNDLFSLTGYLKIPEYKAIYALTDLFIQSNDVVKKIKTETLAVILD